MIVTSDIANILHKDCKVFGIKIVPQGKTITDIFTSDKGLTEERIVIHTKAQTPSKIWRKGFVEVNLCVPDKQSYAKSIRLAELERMAQKNLDNVCSTYDGTRYFYSISSIGIEEDKPLKCHYVNVRILFEVLNTKEE